MSPTSANSSIRTVPASTIGEYGAARRSFAACSADAVNWRGPAGWLGEAAAEDSTFLMLRISNWAIVALMSGATAPPLCSIEIPEAESS